MKSILRVGWFLIGILISSFTIAQTDTSLSISILPGIEISAYSSRSDLIRIPASLQIIQDTLHTDPSYFSLARIFNKAPGVRLEERSPGSYRLSIRGSTLRSPFGVRNVKVYLDGFNLTDGGGNTYLQLISPDMISKSEIIKGPASSMYGAGVGGAILLSSECRSNEASFGIGNLGQWSESLHLNNRINKSSFSIFQNHQEANGYRDQSALRRDLVYFKQNFSFKKSHLDLMELYSDLYYQSPGGLNPAQYIKDKTQARPRAGSLPGSVEAKAAIYNKTAMVGASYEYEINNHWSFNPRLNVWYTDFRNPFITNYEVRYEGNVAWRPTLQYHIEKSNYSLAWTTGWEYSYQNNITRNFGNKKGVIDTLQTDALIKSKQNNVFSQLQWNRGSWQILAGLSVNDQHLKYRRVSASTYTNKESSAVLMPRISASYTVAASQSVFVSAARGNSPPTLAEVRPSSGLYNQELLPEKGWNFEMGYKVYLKHLDFTINAYSLKLKDAIVRRNDAAGVEYFVNAGGANMSGLEAWIQYHREKMEIYFSTAYQPYRFAEYKQLANDFDGNKVTGVPQHTFSLNGIWHIFSRIDVSANWYQQSTLPLNDANTFNLGAYSLLGGSISLKPISKLSIHLNGQMVLSGDYVPGPDINAFGNRFYNAGAPTIISGVIRWKW